MRIATGDRTATAGSDYTAIAGTIAIPAGATVVTVQVPVVGDTVPEPDERFVVRLSRPVGLTLGDDVGAGLIRDDD